MTNTVLFRRKLSHRAIIKKNAEQNQIVEDLGALNLRLAKEHGEITQQIGDIRNLARNALACRFSPHTWHRALVAIAGDKGAAHE